MTLHDTLKLALNGCCHEFHFLDMREDDRSSEIACLVCGVKATAGEVAWMLTGAQCVRKAYDDAAQSQQMLMQLAQQPAVGGVH